MNDAPTPARRKLDDLPDAPGVYLYRDVSGRIIYVGKAKSLRSRVRSYFQPGGSGQFPKTDALVGEIHDLEFIVTRTEVEALILENSLVKREQPRWNIRLRDDKNFPYLKMTSTERFPRVVLVRRARLDGNAYFGPYLPASAARRTIQMVARHFKVATCYEHLDGTRPRPCLLYQLNQCLGPCAGLVPEAEYQKAVHDARLFLEGRTRDLVIGLRRKMQEASVAEHFEAAAQHRDLIRTLERLQERRACFGAKMGWERANWFAPQGVEPVAVYSFGRQNWFPYSAEEHRAAREAVAVFDQTSFAKLRLEGADAEAVLQHLCANDVAVPPGRVVYTAMLNERGGFESDLTVTRLAADAYLIVTGSAQGPRDLDWIRRHLPAGARATVTDVTGASAVLGLMGPRSRELLARVSDADLGPAAFPFLTSREIAIGQATARASRVTYVGELGWELYVPVEQAGLVYDELAQAGGDLGLRDAGYYALDSLRMEKAYRAWGREVTIDDTPWEAGLGFAVRLDKPVPFLGREALLEQRERTLRKRLLTFVLEDEAALPWGDEPILRDGRVVGTVTSAGFGHTLGRGVAMGYVRDPDGVDDAYVARGRFELDVAGDRIPARASLVPPYDPRALRVKS
jgi:glycine cleavage system aminomethyltransferase T